MQPYQYHITKPRTVCGHIGQLLSIVVGLASRGIAVLGTGFADLQHSLHRSADWVLDFATGTRVSTCHHVIAFTAQPAGGDLLFPASHQQA